MGSWFGGLMVPKDNIARTPISTGSFVKSYVPGTGGLFPAAAPPAHERRETTAKIRALTKIRNFTAGWNIAGRKKSPGLGAQTRGRG
jgi:hypothetical protein